MWLRRVGWARVVKGTSTSELLLHSLLPRFLIIIINLNINNGGFTFDPFPLSHSVKSCRSRGRIVPTRRRSSKNVVEYTRSTFQIIYCVPTGYFINACIIIVGLKNTAAVETNRRLWNTNGTCCCVLLQCLDDRDGRTTVRACSRNGVEVLPCIKCDGSD